MEGGGVEEKKSQKSSAKKKEIPRVVHTSKNSSKVA